jgi:hypothetical protein
MNGRIKNNISAIIMRQKSRMFGGFRRHRVTNTGQGSRVSRREWIKDVSTGIRFGFDDD